MAQNKKEIEKFELTTIDVKNLKEFEGFTEKMNEIVEANPYIEITDNKTYEEAKKRRTALRSGRTEMQKQDGVIATFLRKFRTKTKELSDQAIEIVQPHETKQQTEIDRYEKIKEEEKNEKAKKEEERLDSIEKEIKAIEDNLQTIIDNVTFDSIEEDVEKFNKAIESEFDFMELKVNLDVLIDDKQSEFDKKVSEVKSIEAQRIENLKKERESKLDEIELHVTRMIGKVQEYDDELEQNVTNYLESINYSFGDLKPKFNDLWVALQGQVETLNKRLISEKETREQLEKANEKNLQIELIGRRRTDLIDRISKMNVENYTTETNSIMELLNDSEGIQEELFDSYSDMEMEVKGALTNKTQEIAGELQKIKEEEEAEEKRMEGVMIERIATIKELGMVEQDNGHEWVAFGLTIDASELYEADDMEVIISDINEHKSQDEKEKERQQKLKDDKYKMSVIIGDAKFMDNGEFKDESFYLWEEVKKSFVEWQEQQYTRINKF